MSVLFPFIECLALCLSWAEVQGPASTPCVDKSEHCESWAAAGECEKNAGYMQEECQHACGLTKRGPGLWLKDTKEEHEL